MYALHSLCRCRKQEMDVIDAGVSPLTVDLLYVVMTWNSGSKERKRADPPNLADISLLAEHEIENQSKA